MKKKRKVKGVDKQGNFLKINERVEALEKLTKDFKKDKISPFNYKSESKRLMAEIKEFKNEN